MLNRPATINRRKKTVLGQKPKQSVTRRQSNVGIAKKSLIHYPILYNIEHEAKLQARDKQNDDEDVESPYPRNKNHLLWNIIGKRRSGKSTKLANVLLNYYNGHFTDIYFFSPTARRDKKLKPIVDKCLKNFTFYEEFTDETAREVMDDIDKNIKQWEDLSQQYEIARKDPMLKGADLPPPPVEPRNLLLLDDCVDKFGNHMDKTHPLVALCNNSYHRKLSIWVASQKFKYLLPAMRVNMDMITIFKCCNDLEKKAIQDEIGCPPKILKACYNDAMQQKYSDLHIHWIDGGYPKLFCRGSKFDIPPHRLVVFDDDDDDEGCHDGELEDPPEIPEGMKKSKTKLTLKDDIELENEESLQDVDKAILAKAFPDG